MQGIRTVLHEHWRVTINFREREKNGHNGDEWTCFETEAQARLAVAWAYAVRLAEVQARSDASDIEEDSLLGNGSSHADDRRLVWWKTVPHGRVCMKDYFYATKVQHRVSLVTEAPTP